MEKLLKTMTVEQLIAIAARKAANGKRKVVVNIRPPMLPPKTGSLKVQSAFGEVRIYIQPLPNEKGEWTAFVSFPSPSVENPALPKQQGEDLLEKLQALQ